MLAGSTVYWPDRTACCSVATLKAREDVSKAASVRAFTEEALEAKLIVSSVGTCCVLVGAVLLLVVSATLLDIDRVDSAVDDPYALMFKGRVLLFVRLLSAYGELLFSVGPDNASFCARSGGTKAVEGRGGRALGLSLVGP